MAEFLQQNSLLLLMAVALVAMMIFSSRSRKRMQRQQEEREREIAEKMVPGAWVHTAIGFWGRFVDADGDIIVLETSDGTEMYWDRKMIREVGVTPPFESELAVEEVEEDDEEDQPILGLDASPSDTSESQPHTTDDSKK